MANSKSLRSLNQRLAGWQLPSVSVSRNKNLLKRKKAFEMFGDAVVNSSQRHADLACNFRSGERLAVHAQNAIVPAIVLLRLHVRPTAVAGLVVTLRVNAVKRVPLRRSGTHILQKCLEAVLPSFANAHTPTAVVLPAAVPWVCAPLPHRQPANEFGASAATAGCAMGGINSRTIGGTHGIYCSAADRLVAGVCRKQ